MSDLTPDVLREAQKLLKALAPKKSPPETTFINFPSGLRIMKNSMIPSGTIMMSTELFDLIYEGSHEG